MVYPWHPSISCFHKGSCEEYHPYRFYDLLSSCHLWLHPLSFSWRGWSHPTGSLSDPSVHKNQTDITSEGSKLELILPLSILPDSPAFTCPGLSLHTNSAGSPGNLWRSWGLQEFSAATRSYCWVTPSYPETLWTDRMQHHDHFLWHQYYSF